MTNNFQAFTEDAEIYSNQVHEIGAAVKTIARLMEENTNRLTMPSEGLGAPFLGPSDEWGLIHALKHLGNSACGLSDEISELPSRLPKGKP